MGLAEVRAALVTAVEGVTGIGPVLGYQPKSIPGNKTFYLSLTGFDKLPMRGYRWQFVGRLCLLWQDAEQAEADLDGLVEGIVDALDDSNLSGVLTSGLTKLPGGEADWFELAEVKIVWRYVDFTISVLDKSV